jgi:Virus neck protein
MTTRPVFNWFTSATEQATYRDLYGEFIQVYGIDVAYIPRTSDSASGFDLLFGDDPTKAYQTNYTIEMYCQTVDGFDGGELFGKFGLTVKKSASFLVAQRAFEREVKGAFSRPQEGDLLWLSNFRALFEIKYVDEEQQFYPLGMNGGGSGFVGYSLKVEKFRYNNEQITTSDPEISNVVNQITTVYAFQLEPGGMGTFEAGELVTQANNGTANAVVVAWNKPTAVLEMKLTAGLFVPGSKLVGANSNAQYTLVSYNNLVDLNNGLADNEDIAQSNTYLNFSEENLFGTPD